MFCLIEIDSRTRTNIFCQTIGCRAAVFTASPEIAAVVAAIFVVFSLLVLFLRNFKMKLDSPLIFIHQSFFSLSFSLLFSFFTDHLVQSSTMVIFERLHRVEFCAIYARFINSCVNITHWLSYEIQIGFRLVHALLHRTLEPFLNFWYNKYGRCQRHQKQ